MSRRIGPLLDVDYILAMSTRQAREAALLKLESNRRDMVSHFLVMAYAKQLCEAAPLGTHQSVIDQIPESLAEDAKALGRSYLKAARIAAAANNRASGDYQRNGDS